MLGLLPTSRLSSLLALLVMLFGELQPQNNPICKAKRYQCQTDTLPEGACVKISDAQEKYYYIRSCSGEKSYCPYNNATFATPALCQKPETVAKEPSLPFDQCSKDADCLSLVCLNNRCKGKTLNEVCKAHADCDVGYFCDVAGICAPQMQFDQNCTQDEQCVNNCLCNNNKCAFYYTFADGTEATNPQACESGSIENGKCTKGLRTKTPGQPCSSDQDCMFIDGKGVVKKYGNCTCGFNAGIFLL